VLKLSLRTVCHAGHADSEQHIARFTSCKTDNKATNVSNHRTVDFTIPLSILNTSNRTKILDFRKANFNMLRIQLQGSQREATTEDKVACV